MMFLRQNNHEVHASPKTVYRRLPIGIWGLGFVSMFMDISSELVHSLLPIFMATVLGTSMVTIGIIEGFAEGAAAITKVFSGAISDYCGKRKFIAMAGYTLSAMTKPIFPLATTIGWVFGARFVDRIGKGIRGAPRDVLVADIAPIHLRGAAYGLRQSLDSVGAFIGPLMAVIFMIWFINDIRAVLWVAVIPAFIAVFLLIIAVREPKSAESATDPRNRLTFTDTKRLPMGYWLIVVLGAVFTLARFSEAFIILRAQDVGLPIGYVPMIMIVMNIFYSMFAYPAGVAADRLSAKTILVFGLAILVIADVALAIAVSPLTTFAGAAFWGLHMAFTQGLLSKLIADTAPSDLRGTAFGVFNLVSGLALFLASFIAGSLWTAFGAPATFSAGASFAILAAMGLLLYRPETSS
ncbi:MAG: MFS transporter [Desulfomonilia bacterium]